MSMWKAFYSPKCFPQDKNDPNLRVANVIRRERAAEIAALCVFANAKRRIPFTSTDLNGFAFVVAVSI